MVQKMAMTSPYPCLLRVNAGLSHSGIEPVYALVCDFWPYAWFVAAINWIHVIQPLVVCGRARNTHVSISYV